ncbi:MAG: hypothetical protein SFX73_17380 [Kofleriaceae bacterium]|nr:hypothetical protein [Kofleriaceae bacterium]
MSAARADDVVGVRERAWFRPDEEPLLHVDPVWRPQRALDATTDTTRVAYFIAGTAVAFERSAWTDTTSGIPGDGWGTTLRVSRQLGPLRIGGYASYQRLDTRLARGEYIDLGVSVGRTFTLSKWMTAWIALSLGTRRWQGSPPPGEQNETTLMLSVGTTFR